MMWEKLILLTRKTFLSITRIETIDISMLESVQVQIAPSQYYGKDIDLYALLCDIRHTKFNNQIITGIKTNLCNGSIGFNCRPRYYVSLKDEFAKNFLSFKIKTL